MQKVDDEIWLYRNIGVSTNPIWDEPENMGLILEIGRCITFVDIDADGDHDMFVGGSPGGYIWHFRNIGTPPNPVWEFVSNAWFEVRGSRLNFIDADGDGDYDLFSEWSGLRYFENTGDATAPQFETDPTPSPLFYFADDTRNPFFVDFDGNCGPDIVLGDAYGGIVLLINQGTQPHIQPLEEDFICINGEPLALNAFPEGGEWGGLANSGTLNPSTADGAGYYNITYTYTQNTCANTDTFYFYIVEEPEVQIEPIDLLCEADEPFFLNANPSGGMWSGAATPDGLIEPAVLGVGSHPATYTYEDPNDCTNIATVNIEISVCSGIGNRQNIDKHFTIFSNPFNKSVIVSSTSLNGIFDLKLMNVQGQTFLPQSGIAFVPNSRFNDGCKRTIIGSFISSIFQTRRISMAKKIIIE